MMWFSVASSAAVVALAVTLSTAATAQRYPAFGEAPPDALVTTLAKLARDNLGRARLSDGRPVPEETPEQRRKPLVPGWFDAQIVERGKVSAFADWCGLDWQTRSFAPLMGHIRRAGSWDARQIAYASLLHGVAMGMFGNTLKKRGACPAAVKTRVDAHLGRLLQPSD